MSFNSGISGLCWLFSVFTLGCGRFGDALSSLCFFPLFLFSYHSNEEITFSLFVLPFVRLLFYMFSQSCALLAARSSAHIAESRIGCNSRIKLEDCEIMWPSPCASIGLLSLENIFRLSDPATNQKMRNLIYAGKTNMGHKAMWSFIPERPDHQPTRQIIIIITQGGGSNTTICNLPYSGLSPPRQLICIFFSSS